MMDEVKDARLFSFPFVNTEGIASIVNSQSDPELINKVRKYAIGRSKYLPDTAGGVCSPISWSQISIAFPNTAGEIFSVELEECKSRMTVGVTCGMRRSSYHIGDAIDEYLCSVFKQCTMSTFEYFIYAFRQECFIAIDGNMQIQISSVLRKPLDHVSKWDVSYNGSPFGVVTRDKSQFSNALHFVHTSGVKLLIPLSFGLNAKGVLTAFWDLLTLRFLRHSRPRENVSYVVDQNLSQLLSQEDQTVFFATAIFFLCSPFQSILDGAD